MDKDGEKENVNAGADNRNVGEGNEDLAEEIDEPLELSDDFDDPNRRKVAYSYVRRIMEMNSRVRMTT